MTHARPPGFNPDLRCGDCRCRQGEHAPNNGRCFGVRLSAHRRDYVSCACRKYVDPPEPEAPGRRPEEAS